MIEANADTSQSWVILKKGQVATFKCPVQAGVRVCDVLPVHGGPRHHAVHDDEGAGGHGGEQRAHRDTPEVLRRAQPGQGRQAGRWG